MNVALLKGIIKRKIQEIRKAWQKSMLMEKHMR